jgi:threonine-phosphate decarboxylase
MLHGHGDDFTGNIKANFSSNVWYGADNGGLLQHLKENLSKITRYPEVVPCELAIKIANYHGLDAQHVIITNGATEAIYLIAHTFQGLNSTIVFPTFSEYADACVLYNHKIIYVHEKELVQDYNPAKGLMFICNPNNPTGKAYPSSFIEYLTFNNSETLFVVDEAYVDFTKNNCSAVSLIKKYENLVIIRSLTKKFCIPGLRLGYLLAGEKLISRINNFRIPWSVNSLAIEAGNYLFSHLPDYRIPLDEWLANTGYLKAEMDAIPGFKTMTTDTTFFLCTTQKSGATDLKQYLLAEHGILIRDASNFKGLDGRYFRICTQSGRENTILTEALWNWIPKF